MAKRANISKGCAAMAERMIRAERDFIAVLAERGDIDAASAERVLSYYRKVRVVKEDAVNGRIEVKHGALLDRDVIRKALAA